MPGATHSLSQQALALFEQCAPALRSGSTTTLESACREHSHLADELRQLARDYARAQSILAKLSATHDPEDAAAGAALRARVRDLRAPRDASAYAVLGRIAETGMSRVLEVLDRRLWRTVAMKVLPSSTLGSDGDAALHRRLLRFLAEAHVISHLEHPAILPLHDLGVDAQGRVYFTMPRVRGRSFAEAIALTCAGAEGWTVPRALEVIVRVCDAMAYAHSQGVIHRDLKPANVMVGSFGETYVVDWGLAKAIGELPAPSAPAPAPEGSEPDPLDFLHTREGEVMGTPSYMAPEQAAGRPALVGAAADVYAVGAILYHLLTGKPPYVPVDQERGPELLERVRRGPPPPVHQLAPGMPAELAAICERAMAREPGARYPSMQALAQDLRAFLEVRVVQAYRVGAFPELRKWMARNRALALAVLGLVLALLVGLGVSLTLSGEARAQRRQAEARSDDVLSLSIFQDLRELEERAERLWPLRPELAPDYGQWLDDARILLDARAELRRKLDATRGVAGAAAADPTRAREDRWWADQLERLIGQLDALADEEHGLVRGISAEHGWGIERRLRFVRALGASGAESDAAGPRWAEAVAACADPGGPYGGLALTPQLGLAPLGRDPASRLLEFAWLPSGSAPPRDSAGRLVLGEESAVVLVLIPGGRTWVGSQSADASLPNHDPRARPDEMPAGEVALVPFFLAKHELTQAQWLRLTGSNPSMHRPDRGPGFGAEVTTLLHPVEQVSWDAVTRALTRFGLELPTEAQWEHAARAGTTTPWSTGADRFSVRGSANLADERVRQIVPLDWAFETGFDDGFAGPAPAGSFAPNAFGLHDLYGNLWEWCRDTYGAYAVAARAGDGLRPQAPSDRRVVRGGSFRFGSEFCRSALRFFTTREFAFHDLGVRVARAVE